MLRKLLLSIIFSSILLVALATQIGVVAEMFTIFESDNCVDARAGLLELDNDENAPYFIPIIWECDGVYESPGWEERFGWYPFNYLPNIEFQGIVTLNSTIGDNYQRYLDTYNQLESSNSPIDLTFSYTRTYSTLDVVADVILTGDITTTNNSIVFLVTRAINNDYFCTVEVNEVQAFVEAINGETAQYTQSLTIDPTWEVDELSMVVMIQSFDGNHEILQAARSDIDPDSQIDVTVTNLHTNVPMAGCEVTAGKYSAITDENGLATLNVLDGIYDVMAKKAGYVDRIFYDIVATPDMPSYIDVTLNELIILPTNATGDVAGNWVWLNWQPPGTPDLRVATDFESGIPDGWSSSTNSTGWLVDNNGSSLLFRITDHTNYAYVNNDENMEGPDSEDSLFTPEFELTSIDSCALTFDSFYNGDFGQLATVKISTDGGVNWSDLMVMDPVTHWVSIEIDLNAYLNEPSVMIAFHAVDEWEWSSGWAIDNVQIGIPALYTLVQGYNIYMDDAITQSNPEMITELQYIVTDVPLGEHNFTVKAVFNTGESTPCDLVIADVEVDMPFYPPTIFSYVVEYIVDVTVSWNVPNPVRVQRVDSEGNISGEAGNDTNTRDHIGYNIYRDGELLDFVTGTNLTSLQMLDHEFGSFLYQFTSVYAEGESFAFGDLIVLVQEQEIPALFVDDIEEQTMWANAAYPWTTYDLDGTATYAILGTTFPGRGLSMPFIVFDPQSTTPPMAEYQTAFSGDKCLATFSSESSENDDWLISQPAVLYNLPYAGFWAKSLSTSYGNDKFEVAVSSGSVDVADFTVISGDTPLESPAGWTRYEIDLGDYEDEMVRVGIHCVSEGTLAFLVDDFGIYSAGGVGNDGDTNSVPVNQLISNYPNPFNPETTIAYEIKNSGPVTLEVYNILGKKVTTLVNEDVTAGQHKVIWNGTDRNNKSVASGVYFYKLSSGSFEATNKMILMK